MGSIEMIRSRLAFSALRTDAHSRVDLLLVLRYRQNGLERTRFGISTGRRTGGAVVRNAIRRRLRSLLATLTGRITAGWDVLIICRPAAAQASQAQLGVALERLLRKAGLIDARTAA
jgi:ribonuclease P protein component